jgi:hypothetical protein
MRIACIFVFACACSSSSSDEPERCAPAGTYLASFARASNAGDCPPLEQPASQELALAEGEACGDYSTALAWVTSEGCAAAVTLVFRADGEGLSNGSAAVALDCTALGGGACQANYVVELRRR